MLLTQLILSNYRALGERVLHFERVSKTDSSTLDALQVALGCWFVGIQAGPTAFLRASDAARYPVRVEAFAEIEGESLRWARHLNHAKGRTLKSGAKELLRFCDVKREEVGRGEAVLPVIARYNLDTFVSDLKTDIFSEIYDVTQQRRWGRQSRLLGYDACFEPTQEQAETWVKWRKAVELQYHLYGDLSYRDMPLHAVECLFRFFLDPSRQLKQATATALIAMDLGWRSYTLRRGVLAEGVVLIQGLPCSDVKALAGLFDRLQFIYSI